MCSCAAAKPEIPELVAHSIQFSPHHVQSTRSCLDRGTGNNTNAQAQMVCFTVSNHLMQMLSIEQASWQCTAWYFTQGTDRSLLGVKMDAGVGVENGRISAAGSRTSEAPSRPLALSAMLLSLCPCGVNQVQNQLHHFILTFFSPLSPRVRR